MVQGAYFAVTRIVTREDGRVELHDAAGRTLLIERDGDRSTAYFNPQDQRDPVAVDFLHQKNGRGTTQPHSIDLAEVFEVASSTTQTTTPAEAPGAFTGTSQRRSSIDPNETLKRCREVGS